MNNGAAVASKTNIDYAQTYLISGLFNQLRNLAQANTSPVQSTKPRLIRVLIPANIPEKDDTPDMICINLENNWRLV